MLPFACEEKENNMTKKYAYAMWEQYLSLINKEDTSRIIKNPAIRFTENAKSGRYDSMSDEEYAVALENCEQEASLFENRSAATVYTLIIRMLKAIEHNNVWKRFVLNALAEASSHAEFPMKTKS